MIPAYNSRARRGAVTSHLRRFPQSSCTLSFPLAEILQLPQKSAQMPDFMEFLMAGLGLPTACSPGTVQSPFQAQTRRAQRNQDSPSTTRFKFFRKRLLHDHLHTYHATFSRAFLFVQVDLKGAT